MKIAASLMGKINENAPTAFEWYTFVKGVEDTVEKYTKAHPNIEEEGSITKSLERIAKEYIAQQSDESCAKIVSLHTLSKKTRLIPQSDHIQNIRYMDLIRKTAEDVALYATRSIFLTKSNFGSARILAFTGPVEDWIESCAQKVVSDKAVLHRETHMGLAYGRLNALDEEAILSVDVCMYLAGLAIPDRLQEKIEGEKGQGVRVRNMTLSELNRHMLASAIAERAIQMEKDRTMSESSVLDHAGR